MLLYAAINFASARYQIINAAFFYPAVKITHRADAAHCEWCFIESVQILSNKMLPKKRVRLCHLRTPNHKKVKKLVSTSFLMTSKIRSQWAYSEHTKTDGRANGLILTRSWERLVMGHGKVLLLNQYIESMNKKFNFILILKRFGHLFIGIRRA